MHRTLGSCCTLAVATALLACSASQKQAAVETAVDDPDRRRETFEATLRMLDRHPEYVDEFFQQALAHPATLDRFVKDTVARLDERELATKVAAELAARPASLHRILVETLDAAAPRPDAQAAIGRAIADRPVQAARAISSRPEAVAKVTSALARIQGAALLDRLREALEVEDEGGSGAGSGGGSRDRSSDSGS
jgi:hypothetical protein